MTTYRIISHVGEWIVLVKDGYVIASGDRRFEWGLFPWPEIREHYELEQCRIVPVIEQPTSIKFAGISYDLHWVENNLVRITDEDGRDLTWDELPRQLKDALA